MNAEDLAVGAFVLAVFLAATLVAVLYALAVAKYEDKRGR